MGRPEDAVNASRAARGDALGYALAVLGRMDEAMRFLESQVAHYPAAAKDMIAALSLAITRWHSGDAEGAVATLAPALAHFPDREGHYITAVWLARFGATDQAIELLRHVTQGYYCDAALQREPWLDAVRAHPAFPALLAAATEGRERALTTFLEAGGPEVFEAAGAPVGVP
jgi:hypothetical protein